MDDYVVIIVFRSIRSCLYCSVKGKKKVSCKIECIVCFYINKEKKRLEDNILNSKI